MKLIRGLRNLEKAYPVFRNQTEKKGAGAVVTFGAFDGLHRGHQAVLNRLKVAAQALNVHSVVMTLEPLPRECFAPLQAPARLMSFREKFEGLAAMGIDYMLVFKFDQRAQNTEPDEFIESVFVERLHCQHIILGDDTRFGRDASGDIHLLRNFGARYGFSVEATTTHVYEGERVSSSRIRQLLEQADFESAEKLLGRPYSISGKVVYGRQLGRTLGIPTANVELHRLRAAMSGVYAVQVRIENSGQWLPGVANVGTRPTVDDSIKAILEVHLLDFNEDLYGKRIYVRFRHKVRDEQKFESIERLKERIWADVLNVRQYFDRVER